jgi:hypothetical protein
MLGDLASGADPHTVAVGDVVEKLDEAGDPTRAPGQPVVQRQGHQLGVVGAFRVHDLKAVDHVAGELLAGGNATVLVKPVVIGLERMRDNQMTRM